MVNIDECRKALYRFCIGKQVMCIPAKKEDDDLILSAALDELFKLQDTISAIAQHHPKMIGTDDLEQCDMCRTVTNSGSTTICKKCAWEMVLNALK